MFFEVVVLARKNFACDDLSLFKDWIVNFGYHSSYYKKITVLSKTYIEEYT